MATVLEALFPAELTAQRRALLNNTATNLFVVHWTGVTGKEILDPAHNPLEIITKANKWQVDMRREYALAMHAAKLQA